MASRDDAMLRNEVWQMLDFTQLRSREAPGLHTDEGIVRLDIPGESVWVLAKGERPATHQEVQHTPMETLHWRGLLGGDRETIHVRSMGQMRAELKGWQQDQQAFNDHMAATEAAGNPDPEPAPVDPDRLWQDWRRNYAWQLSQDNPAAYARVNTSARITPALLEDATQAWVAYGQIVSQRIQVIQQEMWRLQQDPSWWERNSPFSSLDEALAAQRTQIERQFQLMAMVRDGTDLLVDIGDALHVREQTPESERVVATLSQAAREQDAELGFLDQLIEDIRPVAEKLGVDPVSLLLIGVVVVFVMVLLMMRSKE